MSLTQESLLSFLLEHGGKVKNSELLNSFRTQINSSDPQEKQHNRDLFKKLVNSVAVVKHIDGVKFVVVKKRYQDFVVKEAGHDDSFSSQNASFSCTSPPRVESIYSDIENNNMCTNYYGDAKHASAGQERRQVSRSISSADETTVKVLNICGDQASRACKSGAVFAVIAVKSPQRDSAAAAAAQDGSHSQVQKTSDKPVTKVSTPALSPNFPACKKGAQDGLHSQVRKTSDKPVNKVSTSSSVPTLTTNFPACKKGAQDGLHSKVRKTSDKPVTKVSAPLVPALPPNFPACKKGALSDSQCWAQNRQPEDMQPPGFPLGRPQNKRDDAKYSDSVPLEPLAHEWLVKCAAGLWGQIHALLLQDTRLAQKKDFMSGFTALHWAAKVGNSEMVHKLVDVSRKRGTCVNVNCKAHGGYTPLHIAAMHGHTEVMVLLVQSYGASVNERDNDGKKAFHYLGTGVSEEVRALVGGLQQSREKTEDGEYREHPKGFNTISKLFQPHIGKKQKTKFAHDW
ncbi:uncharacterized protein sowahab [Sebastes umbrosus]|uniref:uncharacterized protein sowahab n=1 Tax=Sebastes umbrosus TaxID=72105 RepID=UPI00189F4B90|nr:uncharacterized protein sowahab [Sebastes umbrosus]